jgi:hypothetical protein
MIYENEYVKADATSPPGEGNKIIVHCFVRRRWWGSRFCNGYIFEMERTRGKITGSGHSSKINFDLGGVSL